MPLLFRNVFKPSVLTWDVWGIPAPCLRWGNRVEIPSVPAVGTNDTEYFRIFQTLEVCVTCMCVCVRVRAC